MHTLTKPSQRHEYINSVHNHLIHLSSLSADFSPLDFSPRFHLSTIFLFVSSISSVSMLSRPRPPFSIYAAFSVSWVTSTERVRPIVVKALFTLMVVLFIGTLWCKNGERKDEGDSSVKEGEVCVCPQCESMYLCVCLCAHLRAVICVSCFYFPHLSLLPWRPNTLLMCCPISQWLSYRCNISFYHRLAEDQ